MPRLVVALLVLLTFAPSAHAATQPTVTTAAGSAVAGMVAGIEESLTPPGPILIADGCIVFGCPVPTLRAEPGEAVTITVGQPVDELIASTEGTSATPRDATSWTVTPQSVPADLRISVRETTATHRLRYSYLLRLVGPPPPPEVTPTPTVIAAAPPLPSVARSAGLRGRRLTLTVVCPAAATAPCGGTVTVRANGRTLARTSFAAVAPGARRTLRTTLRHRSTKLRATLAVPGAAPVTTRLSLR